MYKLYKFCLLFIVAVCLLSCNSAQKTGTANMPNTLTADQKKEGWQLLFDGISTTGWHTFNKPTLGTAWKAEEGTLHLNGSKTNDWQTANGGDIIYEKEFQNFDLKIEWKISVAGNSGVMFYAQEGPQYEYPWQTGIESQVLDNKNAEDAKTLKWKGCDLYDLVSCNADVIKPAGEWHQLEIISNNGSLNIFLNGTEVIAITIWDDNWKKLIANSKFKDMPGFGMFTSGKIALQDEGNDVWYRNMMIKEL
jgi:Domain of Unknown Function (DUF1080)